MLINQPSSDLCGRLLHRTRRSTSSSNSLADGPRDTLTSGTASTRPTLSTAATSHHGDTIDVDEHAGAPWYEYIPASNTRTYTAGEYFTLAALGQEAQAILESPFYDGTGYGKNTMAYHPGYLGGNDGLTDSMQALPASTPSSRRSTTHDLVLSPEAPQRTCLAVDDEEMRRDKRKREKKKNKNQKDSHASQHGAFEEGTRGAMRTISQEKQSVHHIHRHKVPGGVLAENIASGATRGQHYQYPPHIDEGDLYDDDTDWVGDDTDWVVVDPSDFWY